MQTIPTHAGKMLGLPPSLKAGPSLHGASTTSPYWLALFNSLEGPEDIYRWHVYINKSWVATDIYAKGCAQACAQARRIWKYQSFRTLHCGVRFTLPERDEIGSPALFCEMHQSMQNSSGVYFDPALGHPCRVDQISQEALEFYKLIAS